MTLAPGTRLGRYQIHSLLGAGGMGEVYLAPDTQLDRPIALKIPPATGRLPFEGGTIDRIVHAQPEAIAHFNYEVPAELEVIIRKALRKDRDERYQTARDMGTDLRSLAHHVMNSELRAVKVVKEDQTNDGVTLIVEAMDAKTKMQGTVQIIKENGAWKFVEESWSSAR